MSKLDFCTDVELEEYMEYLYELRRSGITNMYGAATFLEEEFDLSRSWAKSVLLYWMNNFDESKA